MTKGTVIQNVTVVNTRHGSLAPGRSVVLEGGKIKAIAAAASVRLGGTAQAIDAAGKYMVPGYLDMHAHTVAFADSQPTYWPLLIANGVTGIREMSGSATAIQRVRKLNTDSAAGVVDAPEILQIPGDLFRGQTTTAATTVQFVQQQKAAGADLFKIVAGNREAVLAGLAESKIQGLGVAGHLVPAVSALESSNAGWQAIEHLGAGWGLILDCATDEPVFKFCSMYSSQFRKSLGRGGQFGGMGLAGQAKDCKLPPAPDHLWTQYSPSCWPMCRPCQ